ncbi:uncharacterized protein LOC144102183 [Amblyomma americanum]
MKTFAAFFMSAATLLHSAIGDSDYAQGGFNKGHVVVYKPDEAELTYKIPSQVRRVRPLWATNGRRRQRLLKNTVPSSPVVNRSPREDLAAMSISDIHRIAKDKLEPAVRQYYESGADQEQTLKENREAFNRLRFRPKLLVDVSHINTATTLLGRPVSMPVGFSPSAMHQLAHPDGEIGTAQAAEAAGTVMILSTLSTVALEDIRRSAPNCTLWLQTYLYKNRALTEALVKRAVNAGFSAIVLTSDSPVFGHKMKPAKYRFSLPRHLRLDNLARSMAEANAAARTAFDSFMDDLISPSVVWSDISWLRRVSGVPVVVKGVLTPEAAVNALRSGAAAIIVSNHGGRQLDGTPASIDALPAIAAAVGKRLEVYLDSGVRTGADVAKALALGARAVFVGRPVLWGLAYNGRAGVCTVLDIFRTELERTLKLLGCPDISVLSQEYVVHKNYYSSYHYFQLNNGHQALPLIGSS